MLSAKVTDLAPHLTFDEWDGTSRALIAYFRLLVQAGEIVPEEVQIAARALVDLAEGITPGKVAFDVLRKLGVISSGA